MKEIILTRGMVALVDDEDYERINQWNWSASLSANNQSFYASRNAPMVGGVRGGTIMMHREVLGLHKTCPSRVDHINPRATLDNRRSNLRIANASQNKFNAPRRRDNVSGYKGVSFENGVAKWRADIMAYSKSKFLGHFRTAEQAHAAYKEATHVYHGEFARVE